MHSSLHFSKSTLFLDIARYVYHVIDIEQPGAQIRFLFQLIAEELTQFD